MYTWPFVGVHRRCVLIYLLHSWVDNAGYPEVGWKGAIISAVSYFEESMMVGLCLGKLFCGLQQRLTGCFLNKQLYVDRFL